MRRAHLMIIVMIGWMIGGCTPPPAPNEALGYALYKTSQADGYNYTSSTKVKQLVLPSLAKEGKSERFYQEKGLYILQGMSLSLSGAIDKTHSKAEATYESRYEQNNVEAAIRLPILLDYNTQTLYVGTTILNTVLPFKPQEQGRLIRIDIRELLKSLGQDKALNVMSSEQFRQAQDKSTQMILESFRDLNGSLFSYVEMDDVDKKMGNVGKVRLVLGREESKQLILSILRSAKDQFRMVQKSIDTPDEVSNDDVLQAQISAWLSQYDVRMILEVGANENGYITRADATVSVANEDRSLLVEITHQQQLSNFNAPQFTLDPIQSGTMEYKRVIEAFKELTQLRD